MLTPRDRQALDEFMHISRQSSGVIYEDALTSVSDLGLEPAALRVKLGRLVRLGVLNRKQDRVQVHNPAYKRPTTFAEAAAASLSWGSEPEFLEQLGRAYWELSEEGLEAFNSDEVLVDVQQWTEVPASDRVVRIDHNAPINNEALDTLDHLTEALRAKPNDLPLTADERVVILSEMESLANRLKAGCIRLAELTTATAKSGLLRWLLDKIGNHALRPYVEKAINALETIARSFLSGT